MKKCLLILVSVCLCSVWLVLGLGTDAQAGPKTIKISSVLSLTGGMSGMGTQIKPSYEIFRDKINAEGGIYVKEYGKDIFSDTGKSSRG